MNLRLTLLSAFLFFGLQANAPQDPSTPRQNNSPEADQALKAREELEKKCLAFLDRLLADSTSFNLVENRIYVQAKVVEMLWKRDEARARDLARGVMDQISALYSEQDPASSPQRNSIQAANVGNVRSQLVNFLSSVDSRFALEFLHATRRPGPADGRSNNDGQEKNLESQLAAQAAGNDPQKSWQVAEELLRNGPNYQVFQILNNLRGKDPQLAASLANDIVDKIKATDLLASYDNTNFATQMLGFLKSEVANAQNGSSSSPLLPNAQQAYRDVLNAYVGTALKMTPRILMNPQDAEKGRNLLRNIKAHLPDVESQLPARAADLRAKLSEFADALYYSKQDKYFQEDAQKLQKKSTQELLAIAPTAPQEVREYIYQLAVNKAAEQGDRETARKIAKEHLSNPAYADQTIANTERQAAEQAANEGKIDEAMSLLNQYASEEDRAGTLVRWSSLLQSKGDEKQARTLLDEARGIVGGKMQSRQQLDLQMQLAGSYLKVDSDASFELVGRIIERLNEVVDAQLVLSSYNGGTTGEAYMGSGEISNALSFNLSYLGELMSKDFERTVNLLERWQLKETRVLASLTVIQFVLKR